MSSKKQVFKIVPGQKFICYPVGYENWLQFDDPQSMRKVKLVPLSEEDDILELSIKFCSNIFLRGLRMYCIEEKRNGRIIKFAESNEPGYCENSSAFVYDNDRLIKLSIKTSIEDKTVYYNIRAEELKYKYLTWEESGIDDDKYYFSDKEEKCNRFT